MLRLQYKQKILLIISFFYIMPAFSQQAQDDCEILKCVLNKSQNKKKLKLSNKGISNRFINIVKALKEAEKNNDFQKIDSIKKEGEVSKKLENLYPVFNLENYDYIISQEKKTLTNWNKQVCNQKIEMTDDKKAIYVSKPVYSKDNKLAFVTIRSGIAYYVYILYKEKEVWEEGHIIFFCFWSDKTNGCPDPNKPSFLD